MSKILLIDKCNYYNIQEKKQTRCSQLMNDTANKTLSLIQNTLSESEVLLTRSMKKEIKAFHIIQGCDI